MASNRTCPKPITQRRYVSERELSAITGRGVRTLQKDRLFGSGPFPFYRIGRQIAYDLDECLAIVAATRAGVVRLA
jgi:hypothetical protein